MFRSLFLVLTVLVSFSARASLAPIRVDAYCQMDLGTGLGDLSIMTYEVSEGGRIVEQTVATIVDRAEPIALQGRYVVARFVDHDLSSAPTRFLGDNFELKVWRNGAAASDGLNPAQLFVKLPSGVQLVQALRCRTN